MLVNLIMEIGNTSRAGCAESKSASWYSHAKVKIQYVELDAFYNLFALTLFTAFILYYHAFLMVLYDGIV